MPVALQKLPSHSQTDVMVLMKLHLNDIVLFLIVSFVLTGELQCMTTTNYLGIKFCCLRIRKQLLKFAKSHAAFWFFLVGNSVSVKVMHPCLHIIFYFFK